MFNIELERVYTGSVIEMLRLFAEDMEHQNINVIVADPCDDYDGVVYPTTLYIDVSNYDESGKIRRKYFPTAWIDALTGDSECLTPAGVIMHGYDSSMGGLALWVT